MKIDDKLLAQAFINSNNRFMEELPEGLELHNFSPRFEKKMRRLITADSKYGGHIWLEKTVRYVTRIAIIAVSLSVINFATVKAFDVNIWQMIVTKTTNFIHINFRQNEDAGQQDKETGTVGVTKGMKIVNIPEGYTQQEFYLADNMTVQHLLSEKGTITYTESLITETADVNIASGVQDTGNVGGHQVSYISGDNTITAFFSDETFYHIVEIQGQDANKSFVNKIIEELEEQ